MSVWLRFGSIGKEAMYGGFFAISNHLIRILELSLPMHSVKRRVIAFKIIVEDNFKEIQAHLVLDLWCMLKKTNRKNNHIPCWIEIEVKLLNRFLRNRV